MKDLKEIIQEQLVIEAVSQWKTGVAGSESVKGVDSCNCEYRGNKKFGFLVWMINEETAALVAADSAEEWADAYDMDVELIKPAFDLDKGESLKDSSCYVLRIW